MPKRTQPIKFRHRRIISLVILAVAPLLGSASFAAVPSSSDPDPVSKTSNSELVEIVVTAQKRDSTVQTTPISITAYTGTDLLENGITNAQGVAQLVPGLSIASGGPGQAIYQMRGLSSDGGESPTIGFYLGEIPITPPANASTGKSAVDPDLYDLARVEVLRGPQGTLYGGGSMGGTIRFISNPPDLTKIDASGESVVSGTKDGAVNYSERAMVNLPIIDDTAALRLVGAFTHNSGWIDRVVVPNFPLETIPSDTAYGTVQGKVAGVPGSKIYSGVNDENSSNVRASLLVKPTSRLSINAAFLLQNTYQGGVNAYDSDPGTLAHYEPSDIAEPYNDRFTLSSLTAVYALDSFDITSASGYWSRLTTQQEDGTQATQNALILPSYNADGIGVGPTTAFESDKTSQFSQEVRVASRGDSSFKWLVGAFYSDYQFTLKTGESAPGLQVLQPVPYPTLNVFQVTTPTKITERAAFANLSYTFADRLTLTTGVRYFAYANEIAAETSGALYTGSDQANFSYASARDHGWTPMANLSYAVNGDLMVYGSAAKGFREGAGNFPVPTSGSVAGDNCLASLESIGLTSAPLSYKPDTVWTYELGEKAKLASGRVTINSAAYLTRWNDVQEPVPLSCGINFTSNAATAEIKGGEIEVRALLTDHLTLLQSVGFAHAVFTQGFSAANIVEGQHLLDVPEWTVSTTLDYRAPISERGTLFANLVNSFVSSSQDITYQLNTIPARDITNARIGLDLGNWSVALFANNLFNQIKPIEFMNVVTFNGPPYNRIASNQPLTVGLDINVHLK